jgi:hypothetical protein
MESFKEEIFKNEKGLDLEYIPVSKKKLLEITNFLNTEFQLSNITKDAFSKIKSELTFYKAFDSEIESDNLKQLFKEINLEERQVYIVWNYPNEIDMVKSEYLLENWDYFWYGPSDEAIILFFEHSKKIIMITHYNEISFN